MNGKVLINLVLMIGIALFSTSKFGQPATIIPRESTQPQGQLLIVRVFVSLENEALTIQGENFASGDGPVVTLGYEKLSVIGFTNNEIVAGLPQGILAGNYLLTVSTGPNDENFDKFYVTIGGPPAAACSNGQVLVGFDQNGEPICQCEAPERKDPVTWYRDSDDDGYSDGTTLLHCDQPTGYKLEEDLIATTGDCDDADDRVHPGGNFYTTPRQDGSFDFNCDGIEELNPGDNGLNLTILPPGDPPPCGQGGCHNQYSGQGKPAEVCGEYYWYKERRCVSVVISLGGLRVCQDYSFFGPETIGWHRSCR